MGSHFANRSRTVQLHANIIGATRRKIFFVTAVVVVGILRPSLATTGNGAAVVFELVPSCCCTVNEVIFHIIAAGHVPIDGVAFGVPVGTNGDLCQLGDGSGRTALHIVANHINFAATRATVTTIGIIDNTVAEVYVLCLNSVLPLILAVELVAGIACPVVPGSIEAWRTVVDMAD